ncbi:unnamed protein product [Effrenium voratum]|uniref:Uncharacterized protein n=1 Tax=Effrenium voratum TaxID=2562239 RepID=A0AA36HTC1_9DINO|nr:unnamed protein product [Effrenium voratum]CAJ1430773.1 unnamed protein product [Effrenium voratum]
MSSEWQEVDAAAKMSAVRDWLDSKGLGEYAAQILEFTEVSCLEDFRLINLGMAEEVVQALQLELVTAQKFRQALAEMNGDLGEADSWAVLSSCEDPEAPAAPVPPPAPPAPPAPRVQEVIAICIDRSGSMGSPFAEVTLNVVKGETRDSVAQRTRMEAVKAMFYAFRDRVESLGEGKYHLGLLQFDNQVEKLLDTTPALDRFESIVDDMTKRGQTAIYSSVLAAAKMLEPYFEGGGPGSPDLRVLVLTDGQNNAGAAPQEALKAVKDIGATVDAILVGDNPDADLRRIVSATEGECYQIRHLGEGFELLESEAVVSLAARRGGEEKPPFVRRGEEHFQSIKERDITQGSHVPRVQDAKQEHLAKAKVVSMAEVDQCSKGNLGSGAIKRVLQELKKCTEVAAGIHIFPSEDISFWRALMEGPAGTPFEGGVFALDVFIPSDYPFRAPNISFKTPIYHCNVSANGKLCLDILRESWHPSLTVAKCLEKIREMVAQPNTDDALRQWIAELTLVHQRTNGADTRYFDNARESTRKDASLSVEGWKAQWASQ